jgi:hypothetical protein
MFQIHQIVGGPLFARRARHDARTGIDHIALVVIQQFTHMMAVQAKRCVVLFEAGATERRLRRVLDAAQLAIGMFQYSERLPSSVTNSARRMLAAEWAVQMLTGG